MPTDYLTTDTELTSIANAIRTKGGTSSPLVYPAGFVSAIQNIPTGGDVFAFIVVDYPSGSTCTAVHGSTTLTAPDTSGHVVFQIPTPSSTPESWTVSCTDGSHTPATASVSITTEGQREEVTLSYALELITDGVLASGYTPSVAGSYATFSQGTGYVRFHVNSGTRTDLGYLTPLVNISNYSNLHLEFYPKGGTQGTYRIGLKANTTADTTFVVSSNGNTEGNSGSASLHTVDIDLTNVTAGSYYFAVYAKSGSAYTTDFDITEAVFT